MKKPKKPIASWHPIDMVDAKKCLDATSKNSCIKENRVRRIDYVLDRYYLKSDKNSGLRNRFKRLFRNRMQNEYETGRMLKELGIPVVRHLAWGHLGRTDYLLTQEWEGSTAVSAVIQTISRTNDKTIRCIVARLVELVAKLYRCNVYHPDLHPGNLLLRNSKGETELCLVDVHGVRHLPKLSQGRKLEMAGFIVPLLKKMSANDRILALTPLASAAGVDSVRFEKRLRDAYRRRIGRLIRKRMWRVFKAGSQLNVHRLAHGVWRIRRHAGIGLTSAESALQFHNGMTESNPMRLKTDRKRLLSRYVADGVSCIVKEFKRPCYGLLTADRRSWRNAYRVECHHMPAVRYLAWKHWRQGSGYILLEDLGDCNFLKKLRIAVANGDETEQSHLLAAMANLIGWMHLMGVYHRDLKTDNFMVVDETENDYILKLIDLDDVHFSRSGNPKRIRRGFQQILNTLPEGMRRIQVLRALVCYCRTTGYSKSRMRKIMVELQAL